MCHGMYRHCETECAFTAGGRQGGRCVPFVSGIGCRCPWPWRPSHLISSHDLRRPWICNTNVRPQILTFFLFSLWLLQLRLYYDILLSRCLETGHCHTSHDPAEETVSPLDPDFLDYSALPVLGQRTTCSDQSPSTTFLARRCRALSSRCHSTTAHRHASGVPARAD